MILPLRTAWVLLFLACVCSLPAESVNRTPPEIYQQQLAGLLTPLDQVLAGREAFPKADSHGTVLLDEVVFYRDATGTDYRLYHDIRFAHDDSATERMGNSIITFDREHESIFLITAATIRPDGTRQDLDDRAAFIQSPQHEAENGLYTSNLELNLIFPKILPGAITESIILIRIDKPIFPGEFAYRAVFSSGWPSYRERVILEIPESDMTRLHLIPSSSQIPEAETSTPAAGRVRKIWTRERTPELAWEESAPPMEFRAPTLWMTTLNSWDQVAAWFDDLVKDRSDLGPDLEKELEGWTSGLTEPRQIIDKLCAVVANDVRYTGLEFGLAGYQPYPCATVWANRYGDCKDKANLLRALLARKGIRSHLVLLNTERLGRVELRSPSWKQFNHCILAVEQADGTYLFCDPTIKHLPAGQIGRSDSARRILVAKDRKADFVQTPDLLTDEIRYGAELILAPSGEISGWFSIQATGGDAAAYTDYYNDFDAPGRRRTLQSSLEGFFSGAEIVDLEYQPRTGVVTDFVIRAYFLRKPQAAKTDTVIFPFTASWLPTVSTTNTRKFPYATTRRVEKLDVTIALPPGWNAQALPEPFSAISPVARFEASWQAEPGRLRARLQWQPEAAEIAAGDYPVFQRSVRALRSWIEQPARIAHGDAASAASKTALENFPVLATGEGQMRLLSQRFPSGEDNTARRAALVQVVQWFPDDVGTVFEAKVFIALIDGNDDDALLARQLRELLARYETQISLESRMWARYLESRSRWWATKDPAAIKDLQEMAGDKTISPYRRAWCAYYAGAFLSEKEPAAALAYLKDFDTQPEEARENILNLEARLLYRLADPAATRAWGERLARLPAAEADELFANLIATLIKKRSETPEAAYSHLGAALTPVLQPLATLPKTAAQLVQLNAIAGSVLNRDKLDRILTDWIKANPRPWITREKSTAFKDTSALLNHLKEKNDASQGQVVIDGCFQLFRYHDVDYPTYAKYLYWVAWWLQHDRIEPALLATIAEETFSWPTDETADIVAIWQYYALSLRAEKKIPAARSVYQRIISHPGSRPHQRVEAGGELARLELEQADTAAALVACESVAKEHLTHRRGSEYLFEALILNLELHRYEPALALLQALAKDEPKYRDETRYADILKYLVPLAGKPDEILAFWRRQESWRPAWDALLRKHGVTPPAVHQLPLITSIGEVQKELAGAVQAKDPRKFLRPLDLLVRQAQWVPLFTSNVCQQSATSSNISPQLITDLYEFALGVVTDFPVFDDVAERNARLWHTSMLIDLRRPAEARPLARQLFEEFGISHSFGSVGLRLWLLASADSDELPAALAAATTCLTSGQLVDKRADTVATLSDSLTTHQRIAENITLLSRELNHPDILANASIKERLAQRLEFLRKDSSAGAEFTVQLRAWLKSRKLEWVLAVPPLTLEHPRYASPTGNGIYASPPLSFNESSICNLRLALDENKPVDVRYRAFDNFSVTLSLQVTDAGEYADYYVSVLRLKALPEELRTEILSGRVAFLLKFGHPAEATKLLAAEPDAKVRERLQKLYGPSIATAKVLQTYQAAKATEAFKAMLNEPVGQFELSMLKAVLTRMVYAGDTALANSLVEGATTLKPAAGASQSANGLRLDWTRHIRRETANLPFYDNIRTVLARHCAPSPADAKAFRKLTWALGLNNLTHKDRGRAIAAYFVEKEYSFFEPVAILSMLSSATSFVGNLNDLGPDLQSAILQAEIDDTTRAQWLQAIIGTIDVDTAAVRERALKECTDFLAHKDATAHAQSRRAIHLHLAFLALRTATEERPDALFGPQATRDLGQQIGTNLQLVYLASRQQTTAAVALMESIDADLLTGANEFPYAQQLLGAQGNQAELNLLTSAAREKFVSELATQWIDAKPAHILQAAYVARLINAADFLPDAFFDQALSAQADEFDQHLVRLARASLHRNWAAQRKAAHAMLERLDEYYLANYYRGEAHFHLGDFAAAKKDLEVFSSKALESQHLPEARRLLAEIAAKK